MRSVPDNVEFYRLALSQRVGLSYGLIEEIDDAVFFSTIRCHCVCGSAPSELDHVVRIVITGERQGFPGCLLFQRTQRTFEIGHIDR
ncbi:hypothetical protein WT08_00215 [Burkholderia sp. MSMB1552]|nr:hypothetical protein WT08_00215 [Burkholderia sp. MSMB1552]